MSSRLRRLLLVSCVTLLLIAPGCLSIGGKTVVDNPETTARLSALESRVGVLEQALGRAPSPPVMVPSP